MELGWQAREVEITWSGMRTMVYHDVVNDPAAQNSMSRQPAVAAKPIKSLLYLYSYRQNPGRRVTGNSKAPWLAAIFASRAVPLLYLSAEAECVSQQTAHQATTG